MYTILSYRTFSQDVQKSEVYRKTENLTWLALKEQHWQKIR